MQRLLDGGNYKCQSDWLKTKVDRLTKSLGLTAPLEHSSATVTDGRQPKDHPCISFGPIEARLKFETIFPSLMVITDGDLQDLCNKFGNRSLSTFAKRKFFIPTETVKTQECLAHLSNPSGSIYPEVRISRPISIDDVESFSEKSGRLLWPTEVPE